MFATKNNRHKLNKKISKGLSLIEASMVLALSAIVVSGVLYYYNNASSNRKLEEDEKMIQMVLTSIRTLYENQKTTTPIDVEAVAKYGNFTLKDKSSSECSANNMTSPCLIMPTGDVLYVLDGSSYYNRRIYSLSFRTKDKNICTHIASNKYGTSHIATQVTNSSVDTIATLLTKPASDRYMTVDEAAKACESQIGSKNQNSARVYMAFSG